MTSALTSVGVQQFSITIASGSLTGTATISTVGSGAILSWQGETATDSAAQIDDTSAYLTISGTTVTATRGVTGSSQTITVNGVVTDFNTTNIAKSVQTGTVAITTTNTSGTATISSVTNTNTGVLYLGETTSSSVTTLSGAFVTLNLSGTTLTASRTSGVTSTTLTAGYCIFEAQSTALNSSTQQTTHTNANSGTSDTATISSVTTNNTMVCYGGEKYANSSTPSLDFTNIQLTGATTLTYTWNASGVLPAVSNSTVMEFVSSLLAANVQRGTITVSAATSNTAAITSSTTTQTLLNWLYNTSTTTVFNLATASHKITQTNATTVTESINSSGTGTGSYEAINFNPASAATGNILPFPWMNTTGNMRDTTGGMRMDDNDPPYIPDYMIPGGPSCLSSRL